MRPSLLLVPVFLVLLLSGCLGAEETEPLDAGAPGPSQGPPPSGEPVTAGLARRPNGTGLLVQHFEGASEYGETLPIGWSSSLGRGVHVADVQVPANATVLQFELRHDATLDVDPYVLAPRGPCGGSDGGLDTAPLTGYFQEEPGFYVDRGDGDLVRLDADVLERHGCQRPCPDVRAPEYDRTCRTWRLGFRVDPASGPFAWEAALTVAVDAPPEDGYRALS